MTTALADVTLETSVLPPIRVSTGEAVTVINGGDAGELGAPGLAGAVRSALLGFLRPRLTIESSFLGAPKVIERNGAPLPWPVGLALVVLPIALVLGAFGTLLLRRSK